jgi:phage protein U
MYLCLGKFVFSYLAVPFQSLSRNTSWRIAEHKRIGERPVLQFVGPDSDKITIKGVCYPQINDAAMDITTPKTLINVGFEGGFNSGIVQSAMSNPAGLKDAIISKVSTLASQSVSLDPLRQMADAGESYVLVDQWGYIYGRWAIQSITDDQSFFMRGRAQKIEFSLSLVRDENKDTVLGGGKWKELTKARSIIGALASTKLGKTASSALKDALASVGKIIP